MATPGLTPAQRVAALSPTQRALLSRRLLADAAGPVGRCIPIQRRDTREFPLSFTQRRLYFLQQLDPESSLLNMPGALRWREALDLATLARALDELVRRHESLRTTFRQSGGSVVQVVAAAEHGRMPLRTMDLRDAPERLEQVLAEEAARPFDLGTGPVVRVLLVQLGEADHVLLLTAHHIVADGTSARILTRELIALYTSFRAGVASPLDAPTLQYADYATWQHQPEQVASLERGLTYWRERLRGMPEVLEVPRDRPRPARQLFAGARFIDHFDARLTASLAAVGQREGATLFMVLLAAFDVLLARFTGQTDLVVGSHVAGRDRTELSDVVGCFINTLPMRTDVSGNPTFGDVLQRVKDTCVGALAHQEVPFDRLVEELRPERDPSRNPIVQVVLGLQDSPALPPDGRIEILDVHHGASVYDLALSMFRQRDGSIEAVLEYSTDLYDETTARRLLSVFHGVLEQIAADPDRRLNDVLIVPEVELRQVLDDWNQTHADYPRERGFDDLFRARAAEVPDAVAASDERETLTYSGLDTRAGCIAHALRHAGVGPDVVVPLLGGRSVRLLSAMLGVFRAGGAYLPLDPHMPVARLAHILQEIRPRVVVIDDDARPTLEEALSRMPGQVWPEVVSLDTPLDAADHTLQTPCEPHPDSLAYVIYTSGSTGAPKGVMVQHGGMLNHLYAKLAELRMTPGDLVAQTAPQTFDIAVWQFLAPLLVGGQVRIYADEVTHDPRRLLEALERDRVSIVELVPSMLSSVLDVAEQTQSSALIDVRWVVATGEALPPATCRRWFAQFPDVPIVNAYGPTECSDDVTHAVLDELRQSDAASVPIGRPVANTRLYVLDRRLQAVPIGVPGELLIGGDGVARGYVTRPDLTAERFVPDPFGAAPGARLYRSGDLVRWRSDGTLEFLGRLDHQVKLRGFRIELGEIETALLRHPGVRDAVVLARESPAGESLLVAYTVLDEDASPTPETLRTYLRESLPEYMQPGIFVSLERLPLLRNGKADRRALLQLELDPTSCQSRRPRVAPRSTWESELAEIWAELLKLPYERLSVEDNFFALGGHSLMAAQLIARVRDRLGLDIPVRQVFVAPTLAALAAALDTLHWLTSSQSSSSAAELVRAWESLEEGVL